MASSPGHHLVCDNTLVATGFEPLLQEQNLGVVIGSLGEDAATASPG